MKKSITTIVTLALVVVMALAFIACSGSKGATQIGTWESSVLNFTTIEQGKLGSAYINNITLYDDGTFVLTTVQNDYYSSDGGETYNPVSNIGVILYGKYETVELDEEIGDRTIKITEITRLVNHEFDSAVSASDADKEAIANNEAIGTEIILGSDHKMANQISALIFYKIGGVESPW